MVSDEIPDEMKRSRGEEEGEARRRGMKACVKRWVEATLVLKARVKVSRVVSLPSRSGKS